jgi:hypothetical protein
LATQRFLFKVIGSAQNGVADISVRRIYGIGLALIGSYPKHGS